METKPHILVVDDDDRLRALIGDYLSEQGFYVTAADSAAEARAVLERFAADALVLDVMMPGENGLVLLKNLPSPRPPALFLSARGEAEARIEGLEAGADDYLAKPFEPKELVLRLRAILRRHLQKGRVVFGPCEFDRESMRLYCREASVHLTGGETKLLGLLAAQAGQAVSRADLALSMQAESERVVDVQITRLRKKIEADPAKPVYIHTVRGIGYRLAATPKPS